MSRPSTRERILAEAERQFIRNGIQATQMKEVAEAVGINRRTLYRYFPTKEELAFAVEMIVLGQLQFAAEPEPSEMEGLDGYGKVVYYFNHLSLEGLRNQLKFTAEFDRYFQDEYPSAALEESFVELLDPRNDRLFEYIREGVADGSIRGDLPPEETFMFVSQNFFGFFQRLIIREKHLVHEHCENMDFQNLFRKIILQGIRNISPPRQH